MRKSSNQKQPTASSHVEENEEIDWEMRPGGMLVQKRDDVVVDDGASAPAAESTGGPTIKVTVCHGPAHHVLHVPAHSTFGKSFFFYSLPLYLYFCIFLWVLFINLC